MKADVMIELIGGEKIVPNQVYDLAMVIHNVGSKTSVTWDGKVRFYTRRQKGEITKLFGRRV